MGAGVGPVHEGLFAWVVENGPFGQGDVCCDPSDGDSGEETQQDNHTAMVIITSCGPAENTVTGAFKTALTCLQIDALRSQIVLFASYLLPGKTQ